jgi:hypothetical protein
MSVLTREVILAEIKSGRLNIDPFCPEQLGAISPWATKFGSSSPATGPSTCERTPIIATTRGSIH